MQELLAEILCPVLWKQLGEQPTVPLAFKTWVGEFVIRDYHPTYGFFFLMWFINSVRAGEKKDRIVLQENRKLLCMSVAFLDGNKAKSCENV